MRLISWICGLTLIWLLSCIACDTLLYAQASTPPAITLSPGENIESAVAAAPAGTTFVLLPGVYRMQMVQPKNGDTFNGQQGVILNGSQVLSFQLDSAASGLWVANANANTVNHGSCQSTYPL